MSSLITNATIQIRKDTAGNWTSNSPTPAAGELCLETDTKAVKIGDGSTAWTSLNYGSGVKFTDTIIALDGITVPVLHVQDQKTSGTEGGTFTNGAWRTRDLNQSVKNTITGASLSSNQITLPAGTYRITGSAPGFGVARHATRFYDITNSAVVISGTSEYAGTTVIQSRSFIKKVIVAATEVIFELQHRCATTRATNGLGIGAGVSFTVATEIYADVFIEKIS